MGFLEKVFGTHSERELKRIYPIVDQIEALEEGISQLSDQELAAKTDEFKQKLNDGQTMDDILAEAFAVAREAAKRVIGLRAYRVQLVGAVVLHQGRIAEMKTGEGKTLVAPIAAYLNALDGQGVHIVTVNDYLATRDAEWMGKVFTFLGLSVGVITNELNNEERRKAYHCDITYGTNNEFGFDYLRDNMVIFKKEMVQRGLKYAIIDEVDSVLVDEARTPLIISGSSNKSTHLYQQAHMLALRLKEGRVIGEISKLSALMNEDIQEEGDYVIDEKENSATLTAEGMKKAEEFFQIENLSDAQNMEISHHITLALKALRLMHRDKDYVIKEDEIVIVDEFTGRLMPGRRYSNGLHQAIEAKENVKVKRESKTLATITFQNYFNKYTKKAGMTGTALTEEEEFRAIYGMDVIAIPTNRPIARIDHNDVVYKTVVEKYRAITNEVKESNQRQQPVLVGTVSIESSEELSKYFKRAGISHNVLNAKFHEREAEIVADAGRLGAVTIATNMAGRGTDIKLENGVQDLGGLKIIGTERHESRRIDNQLRGRSGRQGDPGESRFFISLEDDLMRLFGSDRMKATVERLRLPEDEPISAGILSNRIEDAQKKVEGNNFGIRKRLLDYDQVMNEQREIIYEERQKVLEGNNVRPSIIKMMDQIIERVVNSHSNGMDHMDEWDLNGMREAFTQFIPYTRFNFSEQQRDEMNKEKFIQFLKDKAHELYQQKEAEFDDIEEMREAERIILLKAIDQKWMDHIDNMDQMRQGISLHAYGQRDPLVEYKFVGFDMFDDMIEDIGNATVRTLFSIKPRNKLERERVAKNISTNRGNEKAKKTIQHKGEKLSRNAPCHCGSGKKYKHCHGPSENFNYRV